MSEKKQLIRNSTAEFLIFASEISETETIWKFRIVQTEGLREMA